VSVAASCFFLSRPRVLDGHFPKAPIDEGHQPRGNALAGLRANVIVVKEARLEGLRLERESYSIFFAGVGRF